MEVCIVEEERPFDWRGILVCLVEEFKQSCSDIHRDPHNDTLRHTCNRSTGSVDTQIDQRFKCPFTTEVELTTDGILLSEVGGVEEMISCFLEGGQHEDALLHFGQTEPGDSQNLPLRGQTTAHTGKIISNCIDSMRTCSQVSTGRTL